jgi:DNA-directed RNA polymerase specialized sigma24 family protein
MIWDEAFDARVTALAADAAAGDAAAWRALLVAVAPELERWAARHPTLRRWRLTSPDDARAVLVGVIERLSARNKAALAEYTTRRAQPPPVDPSFDRLARLDEASDDAPAPPRTPTRAWLLTIARYAMYDHVRRRLGWSEHADRRALGTDAARLDDAPEPAARPPMTDWLTVRAQVQAVDAALGALPADMAAAVRAWSEGAEPDQIAASLGLPDAASARRLIRAGHARLRDP